MMRFSFALSVFLLTALSGCKHDRYIRGVKSPYLAMSSGGASLPIQTS